jgi:hypothetical protein
VALIIGSVITWAVCVVIAVRVHGSLVADAATALRFWGIAFLAFIPIQIVSKILGMIIFTIFYVATTGEDGPNLTDERDKMIELKSFRVSTFIFMGGFFLAMAALALGRSPSWMFLILAGALFIGDIAEEIFQIRLYRRGF